MLIYFLRDEGISLEQHRGVEAIDANILFVLVRLSVKPVAQAFSALKQMNVWVHNAYDHEIAYLRISRTIRMGSGNAPTV